MKKLLTLLVCFAGFAFAQADYVALYEASLTSAASVVTVQAPASSAARIVRFVGAYIYCSVQCDVSLERDGTAATATALTPVGVSSQAPAAKTKAFRSSDVGVGTVIGKYTVPAGGTQVIDLTSVVIAGAGTGKNLTLRTASITGTARISIQFREEN
jgi:hypothetical protein